MDEREREMLAEGERLQKIMARAGIGSRRRCEELISEGRVKVNGTVVRELGSRARAEVDTVEVDDVNIGAGERIVHYAVYKPLGYVSTASDPEGRPKVVDLVPSTLRLYPVGRLDFDSEGLIIVTNDGHLTNILTHPSHEINKTYLALVRGTPDDLAIGKLRHGVALDDGMTAPARVRIIKPEGADTWVELTIHEGRNRQVRRMCETVGYPVLKLIRTRIGRLNLAGLQPGKFRALSAEEVAMLEEQADPQGANADSESADWALAESRGEKRISAAPTAPAKKETKAKATPGRPATAKKASGRPATAKKTLGRPATAKKTLGRPATAKEGPVKPAAGRPVRSRRSDPRQRDADGARPKAAPRSAPRKGAAGLPTPAKRGVRSAGALRGGPTPAGSRRGTGRNGAGKDVRRNGSH